MKWILMGLILWCTATIPTGILVGRRLGRNAPPEIDGSPTTTEQNYPPTP